ncbi:MAG TPA: 3-phosphoshikimate 1-carboxyvinyltransferase [Pyrinomonadaceae bacterium]|nr:3-phosphoshikimate 1-carboxyvinyltransferase [Pyrinomonadaceae bacterium]
MRIEPARKISGELRLPGDKSISHRAAILSALASNRAQLSNFSTSEDCGATLRYLSQLGVRIERNDGSVTIEGVGLDGLHPSSEPLDCGNSGSTMRMLAGVLAGQNFTSVLTGDDSLRSRPMKRIIEPLEMMGARVSSESGYAPLRIEGRRPLKAISYEMKVASAQVKSCILLAGLYAEGRTEVIERKGATRDHTERMLDCFGVPVKSKTVERDGIMMESISVEGRAQFDAHSGTIPGDISSAAFFIAAAALVPGSKLKVNQVGLNPTRKQILSVLRSLGVDLRLDSVKPDGSWEWQDFDEPFGDILVNGSIGLAPAVDGKSNVLRGDLIPQLIDELPVLAVLGTQVLGGFSIRDAKELRVKESDRISATVKNLRAMGARVEEHVDGLTIHERTRLRGAKLDAHGDHRIAMAFTIAALIAEGASEITGAECVRVSFPEFFDLLDSVVKR